MSGSLQRGVAVAAALVLLAALGWTVLRPAGQYRVTEVTPEGGRVRVELEIEEDYDVPADANAVVLAPSLVSDRYVQFSPVYDGGARMEDGAEVPLDRTATPVELDAVYGALDELSAALGPTGANENGALSDLVDVGAANLDGTGDDLNRTLTGFSQAVETLANNRDGLFDSVENLQVFTSALATIDTQVGQFNTNLAAVADLLEGERDDLAAAIQMLSQALGQVAGFVQDNTDLLRANVDKLADVTLALVQQRDALAEIMDVAPAGLGNLAHAYNPDYGTLDTRDNSLGATSPEVIVCQLLGATGRLSLEPLPDLPLESLLPLEQICTRLLSGDVNADGSLDDLNGNGVPDLQELLTALYGGIAPGRPTGGMIGLPVVGGGQ